MVPSNNQLEEHEGQEPSQWYLSIAIFCAFHLLCALLIPMDLIGGELVDTDSYTRLNRVLFIHEQGQWNDSYYPRSNAPYGETIHWTMPMDLLLLFGGMVASTAMPFARGLHWWGVIISPLLHVVAFGGLYWIVRKKLPQIGMILFVVVYLMQPGLTEYFKVGRPDHHSLILVVFCWFLAGIVWTLGNSFRWPQFVGIGALGSVGLWISVEFLVSIGFFLLAYTVMWIRYEPQNSKKILGIMVGVSLVSSLALLIERPWNHLFILEYDRISIVHVCVLGLITVVWGIISCLDTSSGVLRKAWGRLSIIAVGTVSAGIVQFLLFPKFFNGPLADVSPVIKNLLWDQVVETQPLVQLAPLQMAPLFLYAGWGIVCIPFLLYMTKKESNEQTYFLWLTILIGLVLFFPLAIGAARWLPYACILLAIPYAELVQRILLGIQGNYTKVGRTLIPLVGGIGVLVWPLAVGTAMLPKESSPGILAGTKGCSLKSMAQYLNTEEPWKGNSKIILAFYNHGPELLYRTSHQVVGTPMHRNQEGFFDTLTIMKATDMAIAEEVVLRRGIDLILLCVGSAVEAEFFADSISETNFHARLLNGNSPQWIREVILPDNLKESFRLFSVINEKMTSLFQP